MKFIDELEKKYGKFKKNDRLFQQLNLTKYSPRTFLNVMFEPINIKDYSEIENKLGCQLPNDLKEFYKQFNGFTLFTHSLRIYGIISHDFIVEQYSPYKPVDILQENLLFQARLGTDKFKDFIVIGNCGSCVIGFLKGNNNEFLAINTEKQQIVRVFNSLVNAIDFYAVNLLDKYDNNGMYKDKDTNKKDTWLQNVFKGEI